MYWSLLNDSTTTTTSGASLLNFYSLFSECGKSDSATNISAYVRNFDNGTAGSKFTEFRFLIGNNSSSIQIEDYADYMNYTNHTNYVDYHTNYTDHTRPGETIPIILTLPTTQTIDNKCLEQDIAIQKARALLLEYLDEENKQRYKEKKPIEIESKIFHDVKYNIPISKTERMQALKKGKIVDKLCLTIIEPDLPLEDIILTKILHTLFNEEEMIRIANHYPHEDNLLTMLN